MVSGNNRFYCPGRSCSLLPSPYKNHHKGLTTEEAAKLRQEYPGPHSIFTTSDGEMLFLRNWKPDSVAAGKNDIAVLFFHGVTAHSMGMAEEEVL